MTYQLVDGIPVWGEPMEDAVKQMQTVWGAGATTVALMADHHVGYSVPIGGVVGYRGLVSPSGVGYDIACGNKAFRLDASPDMVQNHIEEIMDDIWNSIAFGVGRKNNETAEHPLFQDDPAWNIPVVGALNDLARSQLGTIGSGNHYVDLFISNNNAVWVGVHFGSRGLGHKIATHYVRAGGGKDGMFVAPVLLREDSDLGQEYIAAMRLAGRYAYAGRDWVCQRVAKIIGAKIVEEVHNHHNFAWQEQHFGEDLWVVRKGATPAFPGQKGFIGGSMGDTSFIIQGEDTEESQVALHSTVHGAGRIMSRNQAAGKTRWKNGQRIRISEGVISRKMMRDWLKEQQVTLRGGGLDESPHVYKRIQDVIQSHSETISILSWLRPIGVAMAGEGEFDPFKD
jgi:tRNA-splicing ligase RtcB